MKYLPIVLCALTFAQCEPIGQKPFVRSAAQVLSHANNEFTIQLYKVLLTSGENLVTSPFSAATALSMLLEGANGTTAKEIATMLNYNKLTRPELEEAYKNTLQSMKGESDYTLAIANSIWVKDNFNVLESFREKCATFFDAVEGTFKLPGGHLTINQWVDGKTNHKIPALLGPLGVDDVMLLLNAIYFKGTWKVAFNPSENIEGLFNTNNFSRTPTTFMKIKNNFQYKESDYLNAQILQLPYKGKGMSMVFVLPSRGSNLADIENRLNYKGLIRELYSLTSRKVEVLLPKFKIESSLDLKKSLETLGMREAFTNAADLTGIYQGPQNLHVSKVLQKSIIEINEEGSEAASASAVVTTLRIAQSFRPPVQFRADHPFIFFLYNEPTNTILFMGRYTKI